MFKTNVPLGSRQINHLRPIEGSESRLFLATITSGNLAQELVLFLPLDLTPKALRVISRRS